MTEKVMLLFELSMRVVVGEARRAGGPWRRDREEQDCMLSNDEAARAGDLVKVYSIRPCLPTPTDTKDYITDTLPYCSLIRFIILIV